MVPAHAGVVPGTCLRRRRRRGGPRARGGGPTSIGPPAAVQRVVPAHAGVVPCSGSTALPWSGGPRARGGGPDEVRRLLGLGGWSPRTRGWSLQAPRERPLRGVVPAHAGVVPARQPTGRCGGSGPRARGGGPMRRRLMTTSASWSPRTRGWSRLREAELVFDHVVPAHAGVVPRPPSPRAASRRGPRARGGGPAVPATHPTMPEWSPRTRGWSPHSPAGAIRLHVVPAHAGVVHRDRGAFAIPVGTSGTAFTPRPTSSASTWPAKPPTAIPRRTST